MVTPLRAVSIEGDLLGEYRRIADVKRFRAMAKALRIAAMQLHSGKHQRDEHNIAGLIKEADAVARDLDLVVAALEHAEVLCKR